MGDAVIERRAQGPGHQGVKRIARKGRRHARREFDIFGHQHGEKRKEPAGPRGLCERAPALLEYAENILRENRARLLDEPAHANRLHRRHPHRRHLVATFRLEVHEHGDRSPLPQEHDGGLRDSAPGFETGGGRGRAPVELGERDDEAAPVHHRRIETAAARYAKRHHEATVRPEKFRQHAST